MEGVKVYVHNTVPHKISRSKQWQRHLPQLGAELLEKPSSAATHLLTSSCTDLSADRQGMPHAQVVSVAWLEACMSAQTRVSESSYILEQSGAQTNPGPSSNGKQVQPSLELQAKHAIQLMDVQKAVLYLTAGEPAPQWLAVKHKEAIPSVVVLMLPGIDEHLFSKFKNLLLKMTHCLGPPVRLTAEYNSVHPLQATRSLLTVGPSALTTINKRKREADTHWVSSQAEDNSSSKLAKTFVNSDIASRHQHEGSKECKPTVASATNDRTVSQQAEESKASNAAPAPTAGTNVCELAVNASSKQQFGSDTASTLVGQQADDGGSSQPSAAPADKETGSEMQIENNKHTKLTASPCPKGTAVTQQAKASKPIIVHTIGNSAAAQHFKHGDIAVEPAATKSLVSQQAEADDLKPAVKPVASQTIVSEQGGNLRNDKCTSSASDAAVRHATKDYQHATAGSHDMLGAAVPAPQHSLNHYQISLIQMQAGGYPLPIQTKGGQDVLPVDFVASYQHGEEDSQHKTIVAVDCEMCYTSKALELSRVTLVGGDEQVLLDELVLPAEPIVNYNTAFSGITPQMMKGVTTTLSQIQQRVLKFVGPDTLLVGHSLENDLRVLKLVHLKNLDTAILYPHARWPTQQHSLRHLAAMHLKWTIQQGSHDSKIDAIAALRLVKLKLQHGPFFGTSTIQGAQNLMDALHDSGRSCCMLDRPDVLAWHATAACQTQACLADNQTVAAACVCLQQGTVDCLWLQLWALADLYENREHRRRSKQKWLYPPGQNLDQAETVSRTDCLERLDAQVHKIYDALRPGSLLLVVTGQGDTTHQRHKEERAKEVRYAKQLALATNRKVQSQPGDGGRCDGSAISAMCFCTIK
ncbi:TPA: hypothetical protein ACH3X1_001053 [Trebouxia sp. C0004]